MGGSFFLLFVFLYFLFLFFFLFRCLVQQLRMFVPPLWPLSFSFLFSFLCCFVRACNSKKLLHCATHDTTFSLFLPPPTSSLCDASGDPPVFSSSGTTFFFFFSFSLYSFLFFPFFFFIFFVDFQDSAQYSQAAKWQYASVPGEQSITTDPAGLRPHTFTQLRFQHTSFASLTITHLNIWILSFSNRITLESKKRKKKLLRTNCVICGCCGKSNLTLCRPAVFFCVSSVRRSTIQYWPGLHNIISLAFSRWVGKKLNLFCFFCCSGSAFKSSANESRQKEKKKKNSSISIVHRVPRCSSHPSVGGALLLRLSSYSTPHSSMPTKVGLWILIKM